MNRLLTTPLLLFVLSTTMISAASERTEDVEKSKDHPLVSRFPGYFISSYDEQEFSVHEFQIGEKRQRVEGKYWEWDYERGKDVKKAGPLQISRNYVNAITAKGGVKLYEVVDSSSGETTLRFTANGRSIWIGLALANGGDLYKMSIVEEGPMEQKVTFTAPELAKTLEDRGGISLNNVLFDTGTAKLRPESEKTLDILAEALKTLSNRTFEIRGHTDSVGNSATNRTLSAARAESVKAYLIGKHGFQANRVIASGAGDSQPVASNDTEEGRQLNRRVEVLLK
ncbi:MAG: OmpA family protein [Acidobacteria bacterium]|nr:OmpA family protein [Acidobacteriota bacterium]